MRLHILVYLRIFSDIIDGKHVDAKRAVPREESQSGGSSVATSSSSSTPSTVAIKKVFLGGLSLDTKEEDIRKVLETYGEVSIILCIP